ncbi:MAG: hypothetical protein IPN70_01695 [Candidatus Moraniibacteriota bacterium]|nr:MAG: hypothetical protein IPN70_01695 [Candidatus Moranbacteria bacterium]
MNEKMNTGTPSLNQEELGKEEIKDSLENKMSEENKKYERNEEGEISFGSDAIEKGRQYLLKRLTDLSESMYEGDKENSLRVLNTKALVYMSKAREWFLKNPQRTWNDFAWEERS